MSKTRESGDTDSTPKALGKQSGRAQRGGKPAAASSLGKAGAQAAAGSGASAAGAGSVVSRLEGAGHQLREARQSRTFRQEVAGGVKEVVKGASKGVVTGGGVPGAALGAVKGAGLAVAKSKRGRKIMAALVVVAAMVPLLGIMALTTLIAAVAPLAEEEHSQALSARTVTEDTDMDRATQLEVADATSGTVVPWQVLIALQHRSATSTPAGIADPTAPDGMDCPATDFAAEDGLSEAALLVLRCGAATFGDISAWHGVGERTNNPDSDHPSGHAVDAMVPGWDTDEGNALGWQLASWYRDHAAVLNISYILWDGREWAGGGDWADYSHPSGESNATLDHLDHIHVSVHRQGSGRVGSGRDGGAGLGSYNLSEHAELSAEQAVDARTAARFVTQELQAGLIRHQGSHGLGIDAGTIRRDDGSRVLATHPGEATGSEGEYVSADDAEAAAGVRDTFVAAIAELPVEGMDENRAEQTYDLARGWYLGINADLAGGAAMCTVTENDELAELSVPAPGGGTMTLDAGQVANAASVVGAGRQLGVGDQGLVIALMTALQESGLRNLANDGTHTGLTAQVSATVRTSLNLPNEGIGADWDSVGLFQQRPSMGWCTVAQCMDPTHSAAVFFEALLDADGWEAMAPAAAAQAVQVSAFPDAYAKWEPAAEHILTHVAGTACASPVFSIEGWTHPLPSGVRSSGFDPYRVHPVYGIVQPHNGTDWAAPLGTPILAAQDGVVTKTGYGSGAGDADYWITGYFVAIDHGGVVSTYNHMLTSDTVSVGQRVDAGEVIGQVGLSGVTTGAHLHFQILTGPHEFTDPETFLAGMGVTLP